MESNDKTLKLMDRLIADAPDAGFRKRAMKLRGHLAVPMKVILDVVPGSIIEKAKAIGVTRQTVYQWLDGKCRPGKKHARRIARLTGYDADDVRGRPSGPDPA